MRTETGPQHTAQSLFSPRVNKKIDFSVFRFASLSLFLHFAAFLHLFIPFLPLFSWSIVFFYRLRLQAFALHSNFRRSTESSVTTYTDTAEAHGRHATHHRLLWGADIVTAHTHTTPKLCSPAMNMYDEHFFFLCIYSVADARNLWCKFYSRNRQMCERNARWAKNDSDSICSTNELFANEKISGCTGSDSVHSGETCWVGRNQSTRPMLQIPQEWASLSNIECGRFLVGGRLWF